MAIKVGGGVVFENDFQLRGINGYDSNIVQRMIDVMRAESHTFTVYNSAGTAIKTIYFANP